MTNQYSAAMHYYLQAGTVCSDYFTKPVPPDVYTDQVCRTTLWTNKEKACISTLALPCHGQDWHALNVSAGSEENDQVLLAPELSHSGNWPHPSLVSEECCVIPDVIVCTLQVAVLCQFLREVDYMTAFKALQEQNRWARNASIPIVQKLSWNQ